MGRERASQLVLVVKNQPANAGDVRVEGLDPCVWKIPSLGDLPDLGTEPRSPALEADSLPSELPGKPRWF